MTDPAALLPDLVDIAKRAGAAIMEVYGHEFEVELKADDSPVTEADLASEAIIAAALATLTPNIPVVAEESFAEHGGPEVGGGPFWLVDPLDGTAEFVSRNGEFTVNIALIRDRRPVAGIVFAPTLDLTYTGAAGLGAFRQEGAGAAQGIAARTPPADGLIVVASRRHGDTEVLDRFLADHTVAEMSNAGSSLKFCRLAEGKADLYPRFGRTMEWDTAAGQAVLDAAGGRVETAEGDPLLYAKPGFENPHFIAWGAKG
ncbi:MAG: 3'(2'),5'-bisphosphate nucleotidase CysQ [Alphaproteobacteria bacterium]|jgi:3'(2'), 5'-bisphosphate nucleotidase|nr:3'(2'),5'-bisphosphate nucleotidase CysQ [Alphaproteobacteria bacterium]